MGTRTRTQIIPIILNVSTIPNRDGENEEDGDRGDRHRYGVIGQLGITWMLETLVDISRTESTENDKSETKILGGKGNEFSSSLDRQSIQRSLEGVHKKTCN